MGMHKKTLILMGLTLIGLISVFYFTLENNLMEDFKTLEEQNTRKKVERVLDALTEEFEDMNLSDADWIPPNSTAVLTEATKIRTSDSDLLIETFIQSQFDILMLINSSGRITFGRAFHPQTRKATPVPESLKKHLSDGKLLLRYAAGVPGRRSGFLLLPESPLFIRFQTVLLQGEENSLYGTMVTGRYLNPAVIKRLSQMTHLSITLQRLDEGEMPPDFESVRDALDKTPIVVRYPEIEKIAGYALLKDIYGNPALIVRTVEPRIVYEQGRRSLKYNILVTLVVVLASAVIVLLLLRKLFFAPLSRLSTSVSNIGESGDLSARVPVRGKDKVSKLAADAINTMLESLEKSQQKLQKSEERYRMLVETIPYGIYETDTCGIITFANLAYHKIHGYEEGELIGKSVLDLSASDQERKNLAESLAMRVRKQPGPVSHIGKNRTRDGKVIDVQVDWNYKYDKQGQVKGFISVLTDVTRRRIAEEERARLEKQLRQTQKMEAIGTLAGGIAHDFNNILGAILLNTELALQDLSEDHPSRQMLDRVLKAGYRAADLVKHILTFSRQGEQEKKPVQIGPIIKEALKLLRASLPSTIEVRSDIASCCGSTPADPTQIHQVVLNLCANAAHAMRNGGGILGVVLRDADLDEAAARQHPDLRPGPYLEFVVSDTGHGMTPEVMERIFDPFFTTKKPDEGTGMGLAVVHGIVKGYNGAVLVQSEPGKGTVFRIFFPRMEDKTLPECEEIQVCHRGSERILFVDDEESIVISWKLALERFGYQVTGKTNSLEALDVFRSRPDQFDLVITDLTMPHKAGTDLAGELLNIRPDIGIILCTGFSETMDPQELKKTGIRELAFKPISTRQMIEIIRRALHQPAQ